MQNAIFSLKRGYFEILGSTERGEKIGKNYFSVKRNLGNNKSLGAGKILLPDGSGDY